MERLKNKFKSVRVRLFLSLCIVIVIIILCLITINSIVLETFYLYSKMNTIKDVYARINEYYQNNSNVNLEAELRKIAYKNNFDILIKSDNDITIFSTDKDFLSSLTRITDSTQIANKDGNQLFKNQNIEITRVNDATNNASYILLTGYLVNGNTLYIRMPIAPIEESVRISNNLLIFIGGITIIISGIFASFLSRKFTEPILELNEIANKMAKLDFSKKYIIKDTNDEIDELGNNINIMSEKLETTIKQLRSNNIELEKDIEEKSKIDEMRKQFISDVSHELKTPIALIQGYSEGLIENVNTDEESRKFYAEVILDESNKMDKLVKQLLELMKLEYGKREFNNTSFNVVELIKEVIKKCKVMIEENNIEVVFDDNQEMYVYADDFYIDQIVTNYFTNAIKHADMIKGKKQIKIELEKIEDKVRVKVFNTGEQLAEEDLDRIWGRFYKVDSSRNRAAGGSGIGLALVKAIQNNYQNKYGVENKEDGVEFYFDINASDSNN